MIKVWKLGLMSFDTALKIQMSLARRHLDAIAKGLDSDSDTLLLVEHKPVYTVGKFLLLKFFILLLKRKIKKVPYETML